MHDSDPPQDQFPTGEPDPWLQAVWPRRGIFSLRDRPVPPSSLRSEAEVAFELRREDLRERQEKRRTMAWARRGFVVLLFVLALITVVSSAVIVLSFGAGETHLVVPALAAFSGAGAAATFLCRAYWASVRTEVRARGRGSPGDSA